MKSALYGICALVYEYHSSSRFTCIGFVRAEYGKIFYDGRGYGSCKFFILNRRNNPTINIYQFSSVYKSVIIQISEPVQLSKAERNPWKSFNFLYTTQISSDPILTWINGVSLKDFTPHSKKSNIFLSNKVTIMDRHLSTDIQLMDYNRGIKK